MAAPIATDATMTLAQAAGYLRVSQRTLRRRRLAAAGVANLGRPRTLLAAEVLQLAEHRPYPDLSGLLLPRVELPGSPAWFRRMSASKIAAVIGLSAYESRYALWHRMAGNIPGQPESSEMNRGHLLEQGIADWFADRHRDWVVRKTGTWVADGGEWMAASPDRLVTLPDGSTVLLQCKTAGDLESWGPEGSEDIPPGYRAQVIWEMHVTGARVCYVAVLLPYLSFRAYRIEYTEAEGQALEAAAAAFMDSLPSGAHPEPPNLDDHDATFLAVKELHPDIDDIEVHVDPEIADEYVLAKAAEKRAASRAQAATTVLADAMGTARTAVCAGMKVATRIPGRAGKPPYPKQATGKAAYTPIDRSTAA